MSTVVIAAAASLGSIKQRGEYRDAMAFADNDALRALEAITRHRPQLIVLESAFASTSRGAALINRIKADPKLAGCEVRVTTHDAAPDAAALEPVATQDVVESRQDAPEAAPPPIAPAPAREAIAQPPAAVALPEAPAEIDTSGTRWAPRFAIDERVELSIDGVAGTLIDLSTSGAQVMTPSKLKPAQRVRLTFPGSPPLRVSATIAWAIFEMPQGTIQYRAGAAFVDANPAAIQRFIDANKK